MRNIISKPFSYSYAYKGKENLHFTLKLRNLTKAFCPTAMQYAHLSNDQHIKTNFIEIDEPFENS